MREVRGTPKGFDSEGRWLVCRKGENRTVKRLCLKEQQRKQEGSCVSGRGIKCRFKTKPMHVSMRMQLPHFLLLMLTGALVYPFLLVSLV